MIVYLLWHHEEYAWDVVVGVFATREAAEAARQQMVDVEYDDICGPDEPWYVVVRRGEEELTKMGSWATREEAEEERASYLRGPDLEISERVVEVGE